MIVGKMYFFERANKSSYHDKSASNDALITIEAFKGCVGRGRSDQDCLTVKVTTPTTLGFVSSHKG